MRKFAAMLVLLSLSTVPASAQVAVGPHNRAEAVKIIAGLREIVSPAGLQAIETIPVGGIRQVVSIRSQDLRNPVIIYFHGGPGFAEMPLDWWWNRGWDEYFTVVQWDQRNAGKTFTASGSNDPALLTPERYQRDAEEVVQWALRRFGKRKVFVLGHSWGSMLGLRLAAAHPEWLYAYIGMGQGTNSPESERRGWAWTMARAWADGNDEAIRDDLAGCPVAHHHDAAKALLSLEHRHGHVSREGLVCLESSRINVDSPGPGDHRVASSPSAMNTLLGSGT